ncbi:DUF983 domain-containing protein [Rhizorhabdus sp. FW153]|uniref:DUF983 domain-containing protein n=1 Tax=Rhizorhabdus sp. FW153 TaxID=3400216 RepID=UPI003CEEA865
MIEPSEGTAPQPLQAALRGLCPRCGSPGLFAGMLRFSERCPRCGLDYGSFNVGDGAAAFLILIVGAVVSLLAILVELRWEPPFVVHLILWLPLTLGLTVVLMRFAKGLLLALEFRNAAREGRIVKDD